MDITNQVGVKSSFGDTVLPSRARYAPGRKSKPCSAWERWMCSSSQVCWVGSTLSCSHPQHPVLGHDLSHSVSQALIHTWVPPTPPLHHTHKSGWVSASTRLPQKDRSPGDTLTLWYSSAGPSFGHKHGTPTSLWQWPGQGRVSQGYIWDAPLVRTIKGLLWYYLFSQA